MRPKSSALNARRSHAPLDLGHQSYRGRNRPFFLRFQSLAHFLEYGHSPFKNLAAKKRDQFGYFHPCILLGLRAHEDENPDLSKLGNPALSSLTAVLAVTQAAELKAMAMVLPK